MSNSLVQNISSLTTRIAVEIKSLKESASESNRPYLSEQTITVGSTTNQISAIVDPEFLMVYKNRQRLFPDIDYTINTAGTLITFTDDLNASDVILLITCENPDSSEGKLTFSEQNVSITSATTSVNVTYDTLFVAVYRNRQRLFKNIDFFADSGSVISFTDSLSAGDQLLIISCSYADGTIPVHQYASKDHSHYGVHALVEHTHDYVSPKPSVNISKSSYTFTPVNNTVYNFTGITTLTFEAIPNNTEEIIINMSTGSSGLTLTFPENVKYIGNEPSGDASKEYVMSILCGIVAMYEVQTM